MHGILTFVLACAVVALWLRLSAIQTRLRRLEEGASTGVRPTTAPHMSHAPHAPHAQDLIPSPASTYTTAEERLDPYVPAPAPAPPGEGFDAVERPRREPPSSSQVLGVVGGLFVLIAVGSLVVTAISSGWITPAMQVGLAYLLAIGFASAGAWHVEHRGMSSVGVVVAGTGVGAWFLSTVAAVHVYDLIGPLAGLVVMLVGAVVAVAAALRWNSELLAAFAIVVGCAAPLVLDAPPVAGTAMLLGVALVAAVMVCVRRDWPRIAGGALVVSAPQLASLVIDPEAGGSALLVFIPLAAWHVLMISGAVGFEVVHPAARLRTSALSLAFLTILTTVLIAVQAEDSRVVTDHAAAWLLAVLGIAHMAAALVIASTRGRRAGAERAAVLVAVAGSVLLAYAAYDLVGGVALVTAWSIEAVAAAVLYARLRDDRAAWGAVVYAILALGHPLVTQAESLWRLAWQGPRDSGDFAAQCGVGVLALIIAGIAMARYCADGGGAARFVMGVGLPWVVLVLGSLLADPFTTSVAWFVVAVIPAIILLAARGRGPGIRVALGTTGAACAYGFFAALARELPPEALAFGAATGRDAVVTGCVAVAALGVSAAVFHRARVSTQVVGAVVALAAAVTLYWLSVLVVTALTSTPGSGPVEQDAQVALSTLIAVVGVAAVAFGVGRDLVTVHRIGAVLLLGAAFKVVVIDTVQLDQVFRVLAFFGVGVLLLVGGFVYQRVQRDGGPE